MRPIVFARDHSLGVHNPSGSPSRPMLLSGKIAYPVCDCPGKRHRAGATVVARRNDPPPAAYGPLALPHTPVGANLVFAREHSSAT